MPAFLVAQIRQPCIVPLLRDLQKRRFCSFFHLLRPFYRLQLDHRRRFQIVAPIVYTDVKPSVSRLSVRLHDISVSDVHEHSQQKTVIKRLCIVHIADGFRQQLLQFLLRRLRISRQQRLMQRTQVFFPRLFIEPAFDPLLVNTLNLHVWNRQIDYYFPSV